MLRLGMLLGLLLGILFLGLGCLTDRDRAELNEALREWRGDNLKMSYEK
jgi:hypothetical protein